MNDKRSDTQVEFRTAIAAHAKRWKKLTDVETSGRDRAATSEATERHFREYLQEIDVADAAGRTERQKRRLCSVEQCCVVSFQSHALSSVRDRQDT